MRSFDVFLWFAPEKNACVNNREAGDLKRHQAHYDVIVMIMKVAEGIVNMHRIAAYLNMGHNLIDGYFWN